MKKRTIKRFRETCPDCKGKLHYKNYAGIILVKNDCYNAKCLRCNIHFTVTKR